MADVASRGRDAPTREIDPIALSKPPIRPSLALITQLIKGHIEAQLVSYSHRHKYCIAWMAIMIAIHHQKRRLSIFCSKKDYLHLGCGGAGGFSMRFGGVFYEYSILMYSDVF